MKLGIFLIVSCICIYGYILVSDTRVLHGRSKSILRIFKLANTCNIND